ncbi:hypothetical protein L2Y96_12040 [Luteibacter aegosomaticola]|uniref:hypothetical protein n=1 Tax=Luteibacter aegosomaticola TaxID=2911538 RepID=UPI001FF7222F|nr:hypothetical protein [Luteibacter aegosomaticola]UPG88149.1 hypothetical protein L2Y96_12040 [Luteibacter aegosomaticola]
MKAWFDATMQRSDAMAQEWRAELKAARQESKTWFEATMLRSDAKSEAMTQESNARFAAVNEALDRVPTKLQLALWGGGAFASLFVAAMAVIAVLLRAQGYVIASEIVKSVVP